MAASSKFRPGRPAGFVVIILLILFNTFALWANPVAPRWKLINSAAPARYNHKCAYDFDRDRVVLFGGLDSMQAMPNDVRAYPVYFGYYLVGDVNNSHVFNGLDVVYSVNYSKGGPPPIFSSDCPPGYHHWYTAGDVNGSRSLNGLDFSHMATYFRGGAELMPCPDCAPR